MSEPRQAKAWIPEGAFLNPRDATRTHTRQTLNRVAASTDVYTLACERMAYVMDNHDRVAVCFSGGKDSTAVLNIALTVAHSDPRHARHLPLRVCFFDEEAIPQETEDYVRRTAQRDDIALEWYCLPVKHRNACSRLHPHWWPWAPEDEAKWCRPLPPEAITHHPGFPIWPVEARLSIPDFNPSLCPPPDNTAILLGIRAQESLTRLSAVTNKRVDNYIIKYTGPLSGNNLYKAYPVYDWHTEDVWAAARIHGWDYNRSYDLMEMAGITPFAQRCSPAFGEEPLQKIHMFAQCFPDVWARMSERVPGIGAAQRYALTELYSFRGKPPKPEGITWPEFLSHYIKKFGPREQAVIAERIRKSIAHHYRTTTHPILVETPHPQTGLHWHFLLHIAMRGDLKNRRQEAENLKGREVAVMWRKYATALTEAIAVGNTTDLAHPSRFPTDPEALIPDRYRTQEKSA